MKDLRAHLREKLGILSVRYVRWQHPKMLKILYVLLSCVIGFLFFEKIMLAIMVGILVICGMPIASNYEAPNKGDGYRDGHEGFGCYIGGYRIDYDDNNK